MSALGSLVVKLALETAEYTQGLDKNSQEAKKFAHNAQKSFDDLGSNIKGFALGAAGALGSAFAAGAVVNFAKDTINAAGALNDLSISSGMTVESLSGLAEVGQYSGISAEKLAGASNKLAKNLAGVDEEGKGSAQAIRALRVDFETFVGLKPEDRMQMVAKSMDGFADGSDKSAAAMMLFGKEGAAMLPMLKDLARNGDLVAKVTTEQAAASDTLMDNTQRLGIASTAWLKQMVVGIVPALADASQAFIDVTSGSGGLLGSMRELSADGSLAKWARAGIAGLTGFLDVFELMWRLAKTAGTVVVGAVSAIGSTVVGVAEAAYKAITGDYKGAMDAWQASTQRTQAITQVLGTQLSDTWSEESLGSKLRSRMADMQAVGATSEASKPKIDLRGVLTGNTKAAAEKKDGFDALLKKLSDYTTETSLANMQGAELTKVQKLELDMTQALAAGTVRMTAQRAEAWAATLAQAQGAERHSTALAAEKKWIDDSAKANEARVDAIYKATDALNEQVAKQRLENELLGKTPEQLEALTSARNNDAIATALQSAALADQIDWSGKLGDQYRAQAKALKDLAGLKTEGIHVKAAIDAQAAWEKTTAAMETDWMKKIESMTSGLTGAVEGWLISGQSLWQGLASQVKKTFSELVLRPVIQPVMGGLASGIMGMLGGPASAATGGAGAGGSGGMLSMLGAAGGMFGSGLSAGFGMLMQGGGILGMGGLGTALGMGGSAIAGGSLAGGLGILGGALGPLALGVMALAGLDKKGGGPKTEGSYSTGGGLYQHLASNEMTGEMQTAAQAMTAQYASVLGALGMSGRGKIDASIMAAMDNGAGGDALSQLHLSAAVNGQQVFDRAALRGGAENVSRDAGSLQKHIRDESLRAVVAALQATNLDAQANEYLDALDHVNGSFEELSKSLTNLSESASLATAIEPLGGVFTRIADLSINARSGLIDMAGGLDAFLGKTKGFVDQYYSDVERGAIDAQRITASLGAAGVSTDFSSKDQLRKLLEGADVSTESGRAQFSALLDASASFAQLAPLLEKQGLTLNQLSAQAPAGLFAQQLAQASTSQADQAKAQKASLDSLAAVAKATTDAVQQVGAVTNAALADVVRATRATADYLDDVIRGAATINTATATA